MAIRKRGRSEASNLNNTDARTLVLMGSLYPEEIKGIVEIKRVDDYTLRVETNKPIKDHARIGKIKIDKNYDEAEFIEIITKLASYQANGKQYTNGHITQLVKKITGGSTNRDMRHILATDQLMRTKSLSAVADALRITIKKNTAYYLDFILVADMMGIQEALKLIKGTEMNQDFSMTRIALRVELIENKIQMDRMEAKLDKILKILDYEEE